MLEEQPLLTTRMRRTMSLCQSLSGLERRLSVLEAMSRSEELIYLFLCIPITYYIYISLITSIVIV